MNCYSNITATTQIMALMCRCFHFQCSREMLRIHLYELRGATEGLGSSVRTLTAGTSAFWRELFLMKVSEILDACG